MFAVMHYCSFVLRNATQCPELPGFCEYQESIDTRQVIHGHPVEIMFGRLYKVCIFAIFRADPASVVHVKIEEINGNQVVLDNMRTQSEWMITHCKFKRMLQIIRRG